MVNHKKVIRFIRKVSISIAILGIAFLISHQSFSQEMLTQHDQRIEPSTKPGGLQKNIDQLPDYSGKRVVRVGLYENKPKIFTNEEGQPSGIFIDILEKIALFQNWELVYVSCDWSDCLCALEEGRIDLMPDVAFSPERSRLYDFNEQPVLESWSRLYGQSGTKIEKMADLHGRQIALLEGSIQESFLKQLLNGFGYEAIYIPVNSYGEAFQFVVEGKADLAVANHFFGDYYYHEYRLTKTPIVFNATTLHFASGKGQHPDLLEAIDRQLKYMKSEPHSSYYQALDHWMERPPKVVFPRYLCWLMFIIGGFLALAFIVIVLLRLQVRSRTRHLDQTQETLQNQHRELEQVFETLPEALIYMDLECRIVRVNSAFVNIFQYPLEAVQGKKMALLYVNSSDYEEQVHKRYNTYAQPSYESFKVEYRRKNGEIFTGETVGSPIRNTKGEVVGMLALVRDVTEHRKLEAQLQQAQKMESVGRLAGGVAHDFNNLLAVILGYGEMLLEELDSGHPHHEPLEEIVQAAIRARDLTRQLLAFSRKQVLEVHPVDINHVVTGFERLLRRVIGEDITLKLTLASEPLSIQADTAQLEQVLLNLAINARDAMPEGGVLMIETSLVELDEVYASNKPGVVPGEYVQISMSDTGCGMDQETLAHIFEPFFSTKGQEKGTGLGLATSYGIINQHGGSIWVYSEPENGTIFKVFLPLCEESIASQKKPAAEPVDLKGSETILLVEDNEKVRGLAIRILKQFGYSVLAAENGWTALTILDDHPGPLHLLLTDVIMPGMNGKELYDQISARLPGLRVLYMSGYAEDVIAHQGVLEEGVQFIQKPFSVQSLATKVRAVLDEKE